MERIMLCDGWQFVESCTDAFIQGEKMPCKDVRLPHTCREMPLHCASELDYQMVSGYRRVLHIDAALLQKRLFVHFEAAGHVATVYLNGEEVGRHAGGYTAFEMELTGRVRAGDNLLSVQLDSRESANVPPFGYVIDYLTYGGLYREVWLEVREQAFIADVFVRTPGRSFARVDLQLENPGICTGVQLRVEGPDGTLYHEQTLASEALAEKVEGIGCPAEGVRPWTPDEPNLYHLTVRLLGDGGVVMDEKKVRFGFRKVRFAPDGFYLNGKKLKLRGLNRHQSYPYVGYAMPASMQRYDADILKNELQVNAVRTSHYPQSQHFIDRCDEIGLLVFTEVPGWQCIKDNDEWKDVLCQNTAEMVRQYRNHASIMLWGVRVNESADDDTLYKRTNAIAHELDDTRQTSGVRFIRKSSLLEDVYAYNDFSHVGTNKPLLPKRRVTPRGGKAKGYLISEYNGHMYPTKSFDDAPHRLSHALRHANVLNAMYGRGDVAACFGWCMFDYQTHGDFGSGDRICYHGVMDMFRNAKLAAYAYATCGDGAPVLEVASEMNIGDYPGGMLGANFIFTNADSVRFYKGEKLVREFAGTSRRWPHLPHPPIFINDTIGDALQKNEGYSRGKANAIKASLMAMQRYGQSMPKREMAKAALRMARYGVNMKTATRLYNTYIGNWGDAAFRYRFEAVKGGRVVKTVTKGANARLHLGVQASHTEMKEDGSYDVAAVRIRVLDENGNTATYCQIPLRLTLTGESLVLIGPDVVVSEGGMCGCYVKTTGKPGTAVLRIECGQAEPVEITFSVE